MGKPTIQRVEQAMVDAVERGADGDLDAVERELQVLFDYGMNAVYGACAAWAERVKELAGMDDLEGFAYPKLVGADGRLVEPQDVVPGDRPKVWVARFLAAHVNGDGDIRKALFEMADADSCGKNVVELLNTTAGLVRASRAGEKAA